MAQQQPTPTHNAAARMVPGQIRSANAAGLLARRLARLDTPGAQEAASLLRHNWREVAVDAALVAEMLGFIQQGEQ